MMQLFTRCLYLLLMLIAQHSYAGTATVYPKVIGGHNANIKAWPWMAALVVSNSPNLVFCGGSLIASNWVLTAAHCVFDEYPIGSGNYLLTDKASFQIVVNRAQTSSTGGELLQVADIIVHPGFDHDSLRNDVALIRLSSPSSVIPIETLPDFSILDENGQNHALALGWGSISASRSAFPATLQEVEMPIISNALCKKTMTGIEDSMLCAGLPAGGVDTCEGDSGGPLLVFDPERNTYRQAGITSFGEARCAASGFYGVYTRLDLFKGFISDTVCSPDMKPANPVLQLTANGLVATATWTTTNAASGYRLNFAPYPSGYPITSMELDASGKISVPLPKGSAYFVAVNAYNKNCRSGFSNIEHFVIQ